MEVVTLDRQKFTRWTVLTEAGKDKDHNTFWFCRCDCGVEKLVLRKSLKSGVSKSCGCLMREVLSQRTTTRGQTNTPEYQAFKNAKGRCTNPNNKYFTDYGGRGIEFRFPNFEEFLAHIGPKPSDKHSLDRIDNEGHYEIGNIRWATSREQCGNQRSSVLLTYQGKTQHLAAWARELDLGKNTIGRRLKRGWALDKALSTGVKTPDQGGLF